VAFAPKRSVWWLIDHSPPSVRRAVALTSRRARKLDDGAAWADGLDDEMSHWRQVFTDEPEQVASVMRMDAPIAPGSPLHGVLASLGVSAPRVLDVGAGPVSPIGRIFDGTPIDLVAVDPLADRYNALLDELGIDPPTPTIQAEGERLLEIFPAGSFDVAVATNSLDHCYEPWVVISQMVEVVRPGGKVMLQHYPNEGERQLYRGMHRWNLEERGGHLTVWNPDRRIDVSEALAHAADFQLSYDFQGMLVAVGSKQAG
jgi:SAM-dependent methyltransferase